MPEETKTQTAKIPKEVKELVIARLEVISSEKGFSIGGGENLTRDELIQHVRDEDEIGRKVVKIELTFLRALKDGTLLEQVLDVEERQ